MASPAAILNILVEARTGTATASLTKLQGTMDKTALTAKEMSTATAASSKGMGTYAVATGGATKKTEEHTKATKKAHGAVKGLVAGTGALIGAYVGYSAVKSAITYTNELVHQTEVLTKVTGLDARSASQWIELTKQRGIALTKLQIGFTTLSKQIHSAETGSTTAKKAFHELNIPLDELRKLSTQETLFKISNGMSELKNNAQRAALTQQFFGKSGRELLPILAKGSGALKDQLGKFSGMSAAQFKAGLEAREFQREISRAYDAIRLKVSFALLSAGKSLVEWFKGNSKSREIAGAAAKAIAAYYSVMAAKIGEALKSAAHWVMGAVQSVKTFWKESAVARAVVIESWQRIREVVTDVIKGIIAIARGWAQVMKGIIEVISGILTGHIGRAWQGVKDIFSGGVKSILGILRVVTAPIRNIISGIGEALETGFSAAWRGIKSIFESGVNSVIGFLNTLIRAINSIPGIPNIGEIGEIGDGGGGGGGGGRHQSEGNLGKHHGSGGVHRYSGGAITKPMAIVGEEAPRFHEWVIATNPAYKRANLGYWAQAGHDLGVPGFGLGGSLAGAASTIGSGVSKALGTAAGAVGSLPSPHLPAPFGGLGPYLIAQVSDWIRGQTKKLGTISGMGFHGPWVQVEHEIAKRLGWNIGDWNKVIQKESGGVPGAQNPTSSAWGLGQLLNFNWPTYGGAPGSSAVEQIKAMARYIKDRYGNPTKAWAAEQSLGYYAAGGQIGKGGRKTLSGSGPSDAAHVISWAQHHLGNSDKWGYGGEWCGAFLGADMLAHGIQPPSDYPLASAWGSWGKPGSSAAGNVVVIGGSGHVGLSLGGGKMISGNFGDKVAVSTIAEAAGGRPITGYRTPPYSATSAATRGAKGVSGGRTFTPHFGIGKAKEIEGIGHTNKALTLGPQGPSALLPAAAGLPASVQAMLSQPGLSYAGKAAIAESAATAAGLTETTADDQAVRNFQRELFGGRKAQLLEQLARLNAKLKKGGLSKKATAKVAAKAEAVRGELLGIEGELGGLASAEEEEAKKVMEDLKAATEEQTQAIKGLEEEMKSNRQIAESEMAVGLVTAKRALADMIAGQLGPQTQHRSALAGNGSLGSL